MCVPDITCPTFSIAVCQCFTWMSHPYVMKKLIIDGECSGRVSIYGALDEGFLNDDATSERLRRFSLHGLQTHGLGPIKKVSDNRSMWRMQALMIRTSSVAALSASKDSPAVTIGRLRSIFHRWANSKARLDLPAQRCFYRLAVRMQIYNINAI